MDTHSRKIIWEEEDVHLARGGKPIGAKTRNRIRVRWVAVKVVHARGNGIENARIRRGRCRHVESREHHQSRIVRDIGGDGEFFLVVAQSVTTADHKLVLESTWTPGKTDLGSEIILLRVPRMSRANGQASQEICPRARGGHQHVALFGGKRTKVGVAASRVNG